MADQKTHRRFHFRLVGQHTAMGRTFLAMLPSATIAKGELAVDEQTFRLELILQNEWTVSEKHL
jgi:hypothetical protein